MASGEWKSIKAFYSHCGYSFCRHQCFVQEGWTQDASHRSKKASPEKLNWGLQWQQEKIRDNIDSTEEWRGRNEDLEEERDTRTCHIESWPWIKKKSRTRPRDSRSNLNLCSQSSGNPRRKAVGRPCDNTGERQWGLGSACASWWGKNIDNSPCSLCLPLSSHHCTVLDTPAAGCMRSKSLRSERDAGVKKQLYCIY